MTPKQVTYNIIILQPMPVNILVLIKQHHKLLPFGVTPSYGRTVSMSRIVNLFDCCHCAPSTSTKYFLASPWTSSYQQQQSSRPLLVDLHMDAQPMTLPFHDCESHKLTSPSSHLFPKLVSHAT